MPFRCTDPHCPPRPPARRRTAPARVATAVLAGVLASGCVTAGRPGSWGGAAGPLDPRAGRPTTVAARPTTDPAPAVQAQVQTPAPAPAQVRTPASPAAAAVPGPAAAAAPARSAATPAPTRCRISGVARFTPSQLEATGALPAQAPFSAADFGQGELSFDIGWDSAAPDSDADAHSGRYAGAVQAFTLGLGERRIALATDASELLVSDGGFGQPQRESLQLDVRARKDGLTLRAGWLQAHQADGDADLRGPGGVFAGDAIPPAALFAELPPPGATERAFFLVLAPEARPERPLLVLTTSQVQAVAGCTAPVVQPGGVQSR